MYNNHLPLQQVHLSHYHFEIPIESQTIGVGKVKWPSFELGHVNEERNWEAVVEMVLGVKIAVDD